MQQFILEEQLVVFCNEDGREYEDIVEWDKEEFIQVMCVCIKQPIQAGNGDLW